MHITLSSNEIKSALINWLAHYGLDECECESIELQASRSQEGFTASLEINTGSFVEHPAESHDKAPEPKTAVEQDDEEEVEDNTGIDFEALKV